MKRSVLLVALLLVLTACSWGCGGSNTRQEKEASIPFETRPIPDTSKAVSPEHELAMLDKATVIEPDDPAVFEIAAVMRNLETKFPENSDEEIAQVIIDTRQELLEKGVNITILKTAKAIDGCVPLSEKGKRSLRQASEDCVEILSGD